MKVRIQFKISRPETTSVPVNFDVLFGKEEQFWSFFGWFIAPLALKILKTENLSEVKIFLPAD